MKDRATTSPAYFVPDACDLDEFKALTGRSLSPAEVPHAEAVEKSIPIYDAQSLDNAMESPASRREVMAEFAWVLGQSSGAFVIKNAQTDMGAIDAASAVYDQIIKDEKAAGASGADHFAAAGKNDRIWNSLEKLCLAAPETFMRYFAAPLVDTAAEAWLGPNYQMTAQVNLVRPGGQAQQAHRDYHLGFQTAELSAQYPAHVHDLSPVLTLQGAIAHVDVPIEAGPTKLLPFSQLYRAGYAAWRRDDFRTHFEEHYVQLPLAKGDALFFNPALFHAAGENRSADVQRMVNLVQISSAFGRAMETIDRAAMCLSLFEPLRAALANGSLSARAADAVIAASAEGYSFPTNLDNDPPVGGLAPETQAALLKRALNEDMNANAFSAALDAQNARKKS